MASGVHVLAWYLVFNGLSALFFVYVTLEAMVFSFSAVLRWLFEALQLSSLMQYGLLGL